MALWALLGAFLGSLFGYIGRIDSGILFFVAIDSIVLIWIISVYLKRVIG